MLQGEVYLNQTLKVYRHQKQTILRYNAEGFAFGILHWFHKTFIMTRSKKVPMQNNLSHLHFEFPQSNNRNPSKIKIKGPKNWMFWDFINFCQIHCGRCCFSLRLKHHEPPELSAFMETIETPTETSRL